MHLRPAAATWTLAILCVAHALYASWNQFWTYDEPVHLEWSRRLLDARAVDRIGHDRFDSKTPLLLAHVAAERAASRLGLTGGRPARAATRFPTVVLLAALLAATFFATRHLFGTPAAHLATAATALDPNLAAHGSLATVDLAYALGTWLVLWTALLWAERPGVLSAGVAGAAMGFAFTAKFTAVLLVLSLPLLALVPLRLARERRLAAIATGITAFATAGAAVLAASYLFTGVGGTFGAQAWRSWPFQSLSSAAPWVRLPLPTAFLSGLDGSFASERRTWSVVILGGFHPEGVWYYFAFLWLVKTPAVLLLGTVAGIAAGLRARLWTEPAWRFLLAVLVLHLAYFSFFFRTQLGYRFVLMCVPIAYALAAAALVRLTIPHGAAAAAVVAVLALAETLAYAGNPLSFTNSFVWPKRQAFRLIADSNLDWGQNRDKIDSLLFEHGLATAPVDPMHALPGVNVFGVNVVAGVRGFERHRWLREHADPAGHLAHTYVWFEVDDDLFDRFMAENRRWPADPAAEELCGPSAGWTRHPPGTRISLSTSRPADPARRWRLCLSTRKDTSLGLRSFAGFIRIGPCSKPQGEWETLGGGDAAWFRLAAGIHALCAADVPNRREWLPYIFDGRFMLRGHGAAVSLHEETLVGERFVPVV